MERVLFFPDTQIPYHNPRQVKALTGFIHATSPDRVIIMGDWMDYPQPARWSKDTRAEFEGSVFKDSEIGKRLLGEIRKGYAGPLDFIEGNHDLRPRAYLSKYAPALSESVAFDVPTLLDFDGHGVTLAPDFYEFVPGWIATHGHLGLSLSRNAGYTALNGARNIGKSVVIGHVHKLGLASFSTGFAGRMATLYGLETGHMMDVRKAHYLKRGAANWQAGFAYLDVDGKSATPTIVPMEASGRFVADGKTWN
ncbi:metallophosphoesterase [Microtetraspora malaysiensis]|uniref:metallophosphoesterase n=1 Tax=Microtetraspora malaysiensis TaxID=161358 RepID=UPI003D8AC1D3